ncbi:MAG: hypothetical protein K8F91_21000, partial [Candidatus Obscuribacterales bacterium]|nr:hypothetical protein [Candidatus Obscuribacterales bacterium]
EVARPENVSPTRNGKSPYEAAAAAWQEFDQNGKKWPDDPAQAQALKAQFEQAIVDADAGSTPNRAILEARIAEAVNQKTGSQVETSKGNETVAETIVRVSQGVAKLTAGLPEEKQQPVVDLYTAMNETETKEDYDVKVAELKTAVGENADLDVLLSDHGKAAERYFNFKNQEELLTRKLAFEVNDSSTTRSLYASALKEGGQEADQSKAKELTTEAYGRNIDAMFIEQFRNDALQAGSTPAELLDAALKRPENDPDGGTYGGMSIDVMMAEANHLFDIARGAVVSEGTDPPDEATLKANSAKALEQFDPLFTRLEKVVEGKVKESTDKDALLEQQRDSMLPQEPEKKARANELQQQISQFDNFTTGDIDNARVLIQPDATAEQTAAARKSLTDAGRGDWLTQFDEWRGLVGDNAVNLFVMEGVQRQNQEETSLIKDLHFRSLGLHAEALSRGGMQPEAQAKLKEAMDSVPAELQAQYAADPNLAKFATDIGLDLTPYKGGGQPEVKPGDSTVLENPTGNPTGEQNLELPERDPRLADIPEDSNQKLVQQIIELSTREVTSGDKTGLIEDNDKIAKFIQPIRVGYEELIRRADVMKVDGQMVPFDHASEAQQIEKLQTILRTGKDPETGQTIELTDEQRFLNHLAIMNTFKLAQDQVDLRLELAEKLRVAGQYEDASKYFREAVEKSDLIKQHFMADGKDLIKAEQDLAASDATGMDNTPMFADAASGSDEPKHSMADVLNARAANLSGNAPGSSDMREAPIHARMLAAQHFLGARTFKTGETDPSVTYKDGDRTVAIDRWNTDFAHRPGWDGAQAGLYLQEAADLHTEIKGYNPILAENQAKTDLTAKLGGLFEIARSVDDAELQKSLQKTDGFSQGLSFGAAMVASGLVLVATRGKGSGAKTVAGALTRSALRVGTAMAVAGGVHALTYHGMTGEWESPKDIAFHGAASTLTAAVMYKMVRGEKGNLNLINKEWTAGAFNRIAAKAPIIGRAGERTATTFGDATGKLTAADGARIAEVQGFQTAESLSAGFKKMGWNDLAAKFDPKLAGLKPGARVGSAEVLAIIEKNNLNKEIFEMMNVIGKSAKYDASAVVAQFEKAGVQSMDDFVRVVEQPLTSLRTGSESIIKAGVPDEMLLVDAAKNGVEGLDDAFLAIAKQNKISRVGDLKQFMSSGGGHEALTVAQQWPVVAALQAEVAGTTPFKDVVQRGVHVFDSGLGTSALGKDFLLKNTQRSMFAQSVEGATERRTAGQWGSDLFSGTRRQFQVAP